MSVSKFVHLFFMKEYSSNENDHIFLINRLLNDFISSDINLQSLYVQLFPIYVKKSK